MIKDKTKRQLKKLKKESEKLTKKRIGIIEEFKDFALRGSVVDMAVGVVIGAAFSAITNTLVNNIILPLVSGVFAGTEFKDLMFEIGASKIQYGLFLQAIINFFVIAASIFFIIKIFNAILRKPKKEKEETQLDVLKEIRDSLKEISLESADNSSVEDEVSKVGYDEALMSNDNEEGEA